MSPCCLGDPLANEGYFGVAGSQRRGDEVGARCRQQLVWRKVCDVRQPIDDLGRRSRPERGIDLQQFQDELLQFWWTILGCCEVGGPFDARQHQHGQLPHVTRMVRAMAGQCVVHGGTGRVEVGAPVEGLLVKQLRGCEAGRSDHFAGRAHGHHRSKVDDPRRTLGRAADVVGVEVAVHHAPRMQQREH